VLVEGALDLCRPDLVPGDVDHALEPIYHEEVALSVAAGKYRWRNTSADRITEKSFLKELLYEGVAQHGFRTLRS
jgi:hypothetical protein